MIWEFLDPEGIQFGKSVALNPHPTTLKDKTVVLTWNGKPNGDVFLSKTSERLIKEAKVGQLIKLWENKPFTSCISRSVAVSKQIASAVIEYHPDIVINAQGD